MAGSLIKIDEEIVTSAVASTYLQGIDSTYDVYMVTVNNLKVTTDTTTCYVRVGNSGTADSSANYDEASKGLYSVSTFLNNNATNSTQFNNALPFLDNSNAGVNANATIYLFNWNNSSEYSFITYEAIQMANTAELYGNQGGGVHTLAQSNSEIHFVMSSSTIASGSTFTLYGLKK